MRRFPALRALLRIAALLLASPVARPADEAAPALPEAPAPEPAAAAAPAADPPAYSEFLIRPDLRTSLLLGDGHFGLSGDAGLRLQRVVLRFSYLVEGAQHSGISKYVSGRAAYVVAEGMGVALTAGGGLGSLSHTYDRGGSANATAGVIEATVVFFPRLWAGPLLTLGFQVLLPFRTIPDLLDEKSQVPVALFNVGINPVALMLRWYP
jgi:hypothetical protein